MHLVVIVLEVVTDELVEHEVLVGERRFGVVLLGMEARMSEPASGVPGSVCKYEERPNELTRAILR